MLKVNIMQLTLMNVSPLRTLNWFIDVAVRSAKFGCFIFKECIGNLELQFNSCLISIRLKRLIIELLVLSADLPLKHIYKSNRYHLKAEGTHTSRQLNGVNHMIDVTLYYRDLFVTSKQFQQILIQRQTHVQKQSNGSSLHRTN